MNKLYVRQFMYKQYDACVELCLNSVWNVCYSDLKITLDAQIIVRVNSVIQT